MKKRDVLILSLFLFLGVSGTWWHLQNSKPTLTSAPVTAANAVDQPDRQALNQVLKTYVSASGLVDYLGLQGDRQSLDQYNASIANLTPQTFDSWTQAQQIAFLINAYNALTLKAITDQTPLKNSIKEIFGVWNLHRHPFLQGQRTLDGIEHDILRKNYDEPRIHMALVCAAMSCPPLRTEAYEADRLEAQLDSQTERFLANPEAFRIDRTQQEVWLSPIFEWFGQDWIAQYGTDTGFAGNEKERAVLNFISTYQNPEDRAYLKAGKYKIRYSTYDWSLNRQS